AANGSGTFLRTAYATDVSSTKRNDQKSARKSMAGSGASNGMGNRSKKIRHRGPRVAPARRPSRGQSASPAERRRPNLRRTGSRFHSSPAPPIRNGHSPDHGRYRQAP